MLSSDGIRVCGGACAMSAKAGLSSFISRPIEYGNDTDSCKDSRRIGSNANNPAVAENQDDASYLM